MSEPYFWTEPWSDPNPADMARAAQALGVSPVGQVLGQKHWERAKACVNACVGIRNPADEVAALQRLYNAVVEEHIEGPAHGPCDACEAIAVVLQSRVEK